MPNDTSSTGIRLEPSTTYIGATSGTVVKSVVGGPGMRSLSHDGEGLVVQWLSDRVQDLPVGARVRITIEQLPAGDEEHNDPFPIIACPTDKHRRTD